MRAELKDFSGGITDYIFTSNTTACEEMDNFVITKDKALETRWGSQLMDPLDTRPAVAAPIPSALLEYQGYKLVIYGGQILAFKDGVWVEVSGVGLPNKPLTEAGLTPVISSFEWNKHLFITDNNGSRTIKLFLDNSNDLKIVTAGLPRPATLPTITASSPSGKSYLYSFHYYYEYYVKDVLHVDIGPVVEMRVSNGGSDNSLTSIPVLANSSKTHYDLANIKLKVYRTINGGTDSYLVTTLSNGVTTYSDTTSDNDLVLNELLYISANASDNDPPPVAKYIDMSNNCGWYANLAGYPYRVVQSQLTDPDAVPSDYITDFEEEVTGISSFQSNPVVFTENQVWRIEGVIEIDGSGSQRKVMVADGVGTKSHSSIIKTQKGIFFAGSTDSFYWTDGYNVKKIPEDDRNFPDRYREFADNGESIRSSLDKLNNRIFWITESANNTRKIYVYDMTFNSFTTWSGRSGDFNPTAILCSKDKKIYRADLSGYVFVHDSLYYQDPIIEAGKSPSLWQSYPVINYFKHIAFDFGGLSDINKWVTKVNVSGEGKTSLDVAILSFDDSTTLPTSLIPLKHNSGLIWGDPIWEYGKSSDIWGSELRLNQTRFFKSGKIRCKRKQLVLTNAETTIAQSYSTMPDSMGVVDSTLKTLTIIDPALIYIPSSSIGMNMVINGVDYKILDSGTDTFKLSDPLGTLTNGPTHWSIVGYPHNQRLHIAGIIYNYETLDDKGGYYHKGVAISET